MMRGAPHGRCTADSQGPGDAFSGAVRWCVVGMALCLAAPVIGRAACGDGILDPGEECDPGSRPLACCTGSCRLAAQGTICREAAGECDLPETCDGLVDACPPNRFRPAEICRAAVGDCDVAEWCTGVGPACPLDRVQRAGTECRSATTDCDAVERCTGSSPTCPADTGEVDSDLDGVCDPLDVCPAVEDPTQADVDGDGLGDACDPCSLAPRVTVDRARLRLSKLAPDGANQLRLMTTLTIPGLGILEPTGTGLRVLLAGPLLPVLDAVVPAGGSSEGGAGSGWREVGPGRWLYRQRGDAGSPIRKVVIRQDPVLTWQVRVSLLGRSGDLQAAIGQPSLTMTVVLDPPLARDGRCAEVTFSMLGENSTCRLLNGGRRLQCRQR